MAAAAAAAATRRKPAPEALPVELTQPNMTYSKWSQNNNVRFKLEGIQVMGSLTGE